MIELIGGHNPTVQHLPIGSLKVFGTNPYGENIFRVVWSESRYYLVGASHVEYDGDPSNDAVVKAREKDPNVLRRTDGYKWLPLYPGPGRWVLEMWKSAMGFTGCTPEQYEINYRDPATLLLTLGPYPSRGEYCQCHTFPLEPTFSQVAERIYLTKAGWNYTYLDHVAANKEMLEKKEKDAFSQFKDRFHDIRPAFGNRPTSMNPGKKSQNDIKIKYSTQDLGLPKRNGLFTSKPRGVPNARNSGTTRASAQRN
jgi:hypothetical protein